MELESGWQFLLYQQFYEDDDIIYSRTKRQKIKIEGSGSVISKIGSILTEKLQLWHESLPLFFDEYCAILDISKSEIIDQLSNKFMVDPVNLESWKEFGFEEDQAYMFCIGAIWEKFVSRLVDQAYEQVDFSRWNKEEALSLLATEYSLLKNLLYLRELSKFVHINIHNLDHIINQFQGHFEMKDYEAYLRVETQLCFV